MKGLLKKVCNFNSKTIKLLLSLTMVLTIMVPGAKKDIYAFSTAEDLKNIFNGITDNDVRLWNTISLSDCTCSCIGTGNEHINHTYVLGYYQQKYGTKPYLVLNIAFIGSNSPDYGFNYVDMFPNGYSSGNWYYLDQGKYYPCPTHTHSFSYAANNSNTITATCTGSGTCPDNYNTNGITLSLFANNNLTYNGSPKTATIGNWSISNVTNLAAKPTSVTYKNQTGTANYDSATAPTDAGSYTASITVGTATASVNFTIAKADPTANPSAKPLTYTGQKQELINQGTVTGGEIQFATSENGDYSTAIPSGTNAGNYTVWYKVIGDSNHNDKNATQISNVKINKADVTLSGVTASDKTYDGITDATLTSNGSLTGKLNDDDLSYTVTGAFTDENVGTNKDVNLTVTLTGTAKDNYKTSSTSQTKTNASISKKDITTTITPNGGYYGNVTAATALLNNTVTGDNIGPVITYTGTDNEGTNYNNTVTPTKAGTYTITVTLGGTDASNYNLLNNANNPTTGTFNITKAKVDIPEKDNAEFTFNKQEQTYSLTENVDIYTITDNKKTNAGTYNVKVALKDKNNYEWNDSTATIDAEKIADKTYTFIINPLSIESDLITLTIPETSFILTSEQLATVGSKSLDITLKYGDTVLNSNDFTVTDGSMAKFGKYKAVLEGKDNYTGKLVRDWSITQTKQEPVTIIAPEGEDPFTNKLTVTITGDEDAPKATINTPLDVLTAEDKALLKDAKQNVDIDVILTLKNKLEEKIEEDSLAEIKKITKNNKNVRYLDITLEKVLKTLEGTTPIDEVTFPITELTTPIEITIDVPEDIPAVRAGYSRKYTIIRSHATTENGVTTYEAEVLTTTYSNGKVTFKTDKFSDYALMYVDTLIPVPSDSTADTNYKAPNTGVTATATQGLVELGAIAVGSLFAVISNKKKKEN